MKPDTSTPIVLFERTGWVPILQEGKTLEWGHRFDAGIGYRVFLKYQDSDSINAFPPALARIIADKVKRGKTKQYKLLAQHMVDAADSADKMNKLWADAGAPDEPVDEIIEAGHA